MNRYRTDLLRRMVELCEENSPATCPECGQECSLVPLRNEFDYSGTHCTHGLPGTHYPQDWAMPVSDCCEAEVDV